jgi:large subunit ribosomal protein L2
MTSNYVQIQGKIEKFSHDPGRGTPLAYVKWADGTKTLFLPAEGQFVGDKVELGPNAPLQIGSVKPLHTIPDGTLIFNIEAKPGDGGKFARASGLSATLLEHSSTGVLVELPSGAKKKIHENCRATIGVVPGGGRTEKPLIKAGTAYYYHRSRGKKWPRSRGVVMNSNSHPYGGGAHCHKHWPTTTNRNAPPGRKVGQIAARRTGLRKK